MLTWSNLTLQEKLNLGLIPDEIKDSIQEALQGLIDENEKLRNQVRILERHDEVLHEQCGFARQLLEELEDSINKLSSVKQIRKAFSVICDNSYFER